MILDLQKAIQLDPKNKELRGLMEYVMLIAIRYKNKASEQMLKGIRNINFFCMLISCSGQYDVAIYFLNQALELDPTDWMILLKRGILFSEIGHNDSAVADLLAVLENNERDASRDGEVMSYLGIVFNKIGVSLFQLVY
jgi:tetratricopeptide (TPR) repeat protein